MLRVDDIAVTDRRGREPLRLTGPVSFSINDGEIFGLVGESGSGKSMTALALMRLVPPGAEVSGRAELNGTDLVAASERKMRQLRGRDLAMVFQEPMAALNPVFTIEQQIVAALQAHGGLGGKAARNRAIELLRMVGVPDPETRLTYYPHQLSGGLCQRAMIAMALAAGAKLLIADEPTTSLDVTIQEQILQLIEKLTVETGVSVLFISHDLGVVARLCHRVAVLYAGEVVESGPAEALLHAPRHPYAQGLLRCAPDLREIGKVQRGIPGTPPAAGEWPAGCRFAPRCTFVQARCHERQELRVLESGHHVRCCRAEEIAGVPA